MAIFVQYIADNTGCEPSFEGLRRVLGARWSYHWRDFILSLTYHLYFWLNPAIPPPAARLKSDSPHR
ncbi:hypothetical protein, partial [Klebsiella pneumoniae]|uniref:hypothetical protein n=1 Tax=Klebsiella pneumoniae TaxID=573 RepID=UPI0023817D94